MGGSATSRDLVNEVSDSLPNAETLPGITYPNRPTVSVLEDQISWGRTTAKHVGTIKQPSRGMNLITTFGEELLGMNEADALEEVKCIDRDKNRAYRQAQSELAVVDQPEENDGTPAKEVVDDAKEDDDAVTPGRE